MTDFGETHVDTTVTIFKRLGNTCRTCAGFKDGFLDLTYFVPDQAQVIFNNINPRLLMIISTKQFQKKRRQFISLISACNRRTQHWIIWQSADINCELKKRRGKI